MRMQLRSSQKKILISLIIVFIFSFPCISQEDKPLNLRYQSTMLGIGGTKVYDSYLSPLIYSGTNFGLIYESMKMTNLCKGNISAQHLLNLELAYTENQSGTAHEYWGSLEYNYGLHYKYSPVKDLNLFGGMQIAGLVGGIYNTRNGNNPATGKAHVNLNLSGIATYKFHIKNQPLNVRYQINIPSVGILFSPQYGQSYYEIGLGVDAPLVYFSSFHNYLSMRNLLSVELPFKSFTLRLSYMNWIYETQVNDLDTRIVSNSFYIGFSRNIFSVSGSKTQLKNFNTVFE